MNRPINILDLSDIHLGHHDTKTDFIIKNLKTFFSDYHTIIKNADYITLSGDYFHKLLANNSNDYIMAIDFLIFIASYCKRNNIAFRILEGTPSHDVGQLKSFSNTLRELSIDIDFRYIDTLFIERNEKLKFDILYIPDEVNHEAEKTEKDILKLLKNHNLDFVNHIIMHGQFNHHLPIVSKSSFNEDFMHSICDGYIINGHIHIFSTFDRIITVGSFDRLTHGEENRKGAVYISYLSSGNEYLFLENKHAKIYKTLLYDLVEPEVIINDIRKLKLPVDSHIRIKSNRINSNKNIKSVLNNMFKNYKFKITDNKEEKSTKQTLEIKFNELHITKDNVSKLIDEKLLKLNLNESLYKSIHNELKLLKG